MKHKRIAKLAAILGLVSCHTVANAAAFQFYEVGTPVIGTAGVGQAAIASDASTAYFNPAGMSQLNESALMVGTQFILPYTNFSPNNTTTLTGNNGGTASSLTPGIGLYYVYRLSPPLSFGISINSPFGGMLTYNNDWVGRYIVQQMTFYTVDINPVISYQANTWLSLGAGLVFEYANLNETMALRLTPLIDGTANVRVNNAATGFNLGVFMQPSEKTTIGIAYRSQIVHHMNGNSNFLDISTTPATHTKMVMPASVTASLTQKFGQAFTLLAELGLANWSSMHNTVVTIDGYSAVTPNNWSDTYRAGLGASYQLNPAWLLQAGLSYDSSPTNASKRLPDLPMDRQIRFGLGAIYGFTSSSNLGISYELIDLGEASINHTSAYGVLAGQYSRNYANVLQISLNVGGE